MQVNTCGFVAECEGRDSPGLKSCKALSRKMMPLNSQVWRLEGNRWWIPFCKASYYGVIFGKWDWLAAGQRLKCGLFKFFAALQLLQRSNFQVVSWCKQQCPTELSVGGFLNTYFFRSQIENCFCLWQIYCARICVCDFSRLKSLLNHPQKKANFVLFIFHFPLVNLQSYHLSNQEAFHEWTLRV